MGHSPYLHRILVDGENERAHELLALLHERVRHHILKPVVDATDAAITLHENRFDEGLARAHAVLSDPVAPKQAVEFAAFGVGLTLPVAGRGHEFEPIAQRCRDDKKRTTDGLIAAMVRYCDVLALTYTGQLDLAEERVAEYTKFSSAGQFLAWAIARIMAGVVATQRGLFREAIEAFEQALAAQRRSAAAVAASGPAAAGTRLRRARPGRRRRAGAGRGPRTFGPARSHPYAADDVGQGVARRCPRLRSRCR